MVRDPYEVLDLNALHCFVFVAKRGSVTRAASEIGLTAQEIERLAVNAFRASLLPQAERLRLESEIEAAFA